MTSNLTVPYCTVKGFRKCLAILAEGGLPETVDRKELVARGLSPHAAYPVLGAFRYLGFIDEAGRPTPALAPFLAEDDVQGRRAVVEVAFARVLEDVDFPVDNREDVDEILVERHGCAPGVVAFCSTFFLWLAAEAGLPVAQLSSTRRGRPPAHLAQLSPAARAYLLEREAEAVAPPAPMSEPPPAMPEPPAAKPGISGAF